MWIKFEEIKAMILLSDWETLLLQKMLSFVSDEGERAPLYQPPPKKEVKIEESARTEFEEHRSASTKKRKSVAGLSTQADGFSVKPVKSRSAGATSRVSKRLNSKTICIISIG